MLKGISGVFWFCSWERSLSTFFIKWNYATIRITGCQVELSLVAPGRRGFEWVKWIIHIEVLTAPDPGQVVSIFSSSFTNAGRGE